MKREFKEHISKRCQTFGECWLRVMRANLTGNPSEEDLIEATKAEFEKTSGYQAIQGQREQVEGLHNGDKADSWVNSWKVLRVIDKYRGAAALAVSGGARGGPPGNPPIPDNCDEDEDFVVPNGDEEGAMNPAKRAGRDARVAGEATAIAAAPTMPASPDIEMPDLPAPPTPGRSHAARTDSDGASGGLGHPAPGGGAFLDEARSPSASPCASSPALPPTAPATSTAEVCAAPAVFCLETDDEVGMDATLRAGRAGVTDGARRRTSNGNGAADVAAAETAAAFVPTARMELEAVADVAAFYDQGAAAVVPATPTEQEPADNAESAYQEAAASALERLTRADAAGADLRGTSDEGARSGVPVTARVADAALTLFP
ncbi:hypothetical protein I4F81_002296 [Pyropia yezoensis]|uniref:Uncharacterized protein n=1 Tax=Pyropia yezoensis TaxID=2788 RepID=A0ACC3BPF4_PYRYE|nr:hypothetical protein I4F81_002296 [Neopyropia yezoensis]